MQAAAARLAGGGGRGGAHPSSTPLPRRQPVPDAAGLRWLRGAHPRLRPRRQAEPTRREDPQVRLVPHRPGDARQQVCVPSARLPTPPGEPRAGPQDRGSVGAVPLHGCCWAPQGGGRPLLSDVSSWLISREWSGGRGVSEVAGSQARPWERLWGVRGPGEGLGCS